MGEGVGDGVGIGKGEGVGAVLAGVKVGRACRGVGVGVGPWARAGTGATASNIAPKQTRYVRTQAIRLSFLKTESPYLPPVCLFFISGGPM